MPYEIDDYENLTAIEEKILLECGKMNISVKKNINEETIKRNCPMVICHILTNL